MSINKVKIKGIIDVYIIDAITHKVKQRKRFHNIITNNGLKMYRNWAAGIPPLTDPDYNVDTRITHVAVGDNNTAPAPSQTALGNELLRKELFPTPSVGCSIEFDDNATVVYEMLIDETELNGYTIREIGLFSTTFTDFMVSRFLCGNLVKSASVQFLIKYKIVHY